MVFQYKELARLLQGQYQVYGLQARGLVRKSFFPDTVDLLVADYTRQILEIQKEGPFRIAAYCIGDLYGYYIVHLLEELGHRVEKFIMIDEPNFMPTIVLRWHLAKEAVLRPIGKLKTILPGYSSRSKVRRRYEELVAELNTFDNLEDSPGSEFIQGEAEQMKVKTKLHQQRLMADYYRHSPYMRLYGIIHADMINVRAEATNPIKFDANNLRMMTYGTAQLLVSPGTHHNIFESPQVEKLAESMLKFLNGPVMKK
jgi:thioesterase domain-containing protein